MSNNRLYCFSDIDMCAIVYFAEAVEQESRSFVSLLLLTSTLLPPPLIHKCGIYVTYHIIFLYVSGFQCRTTYKWDASLNGLHSCEEDWMMPIGCQ